MIDRDDLIYMAGIVDGEGCISVYRHTTTNQVYSSISVTNTDIRLIDWIQSRWLGSITIRHPRTANSKIAYQWVLTHSKAVSVISSIRPYLKLKGSQADAALCLEDIQKIWYIGSGRTSPSEYVDIAVMLMDRVRGLNHRGFTGESLESAIICEKGGV